MNEDLTLENYKEYAEQLEKAIRIHKMAVFGDESSLYAVRKIIDGMEETGTDED